MRRRYTLGFVAGDFIPTSFIGELLAVVAAHQPEFAFSRCGPVLYLGRNLIARMFLDQTRKMSSPTPTLVMVDTDMIFGPTEIEALLEHPEPLVSGVYVDSEGDLVVDGCGFLRIDREVLEAVGPHPFDPIVADDGEMTGEDVAFRWRAIQAGFTPVTDREIRLGHVKQVMLWPDGTEHPQEGGIKLVGRPVPMAPARMEEG